MITGPGGVNSVQQSLVEVMTHTLALLLLRSKICNFFDPWSTDTRFRRLGKGVVGKPQRVVSSCVITPPSFVR